MVEFVVLSGPDQGKNHRPTTLPFCIGRASGNGMQLHGPGVWDRHAEVSIAAGRCKIRIMGEASGSSDGVPRAEWTLRNGECLMLGGVGLRFGIASAPRLSSRPWEWMAWTCIVATLLAEAWLVMSGGGLP